MIVAIVVNFFCSTLTTRAVASLLADEPGCRVIVVDNSLDAAEFGNLSANLPAKVELIANSSNTGFGSACNLAFSASNEPYVMLLNPDACVLPGCLAGLRTALAENRDLAAVTPMQWWEPTGTWLLPPAWLPTGIGLWCIERAWRSQRWAMALSLAYRRLALSVWQGEVPLVPQRALSGGAMMVRRESAIALGGLFDPQYFMYYEDSDWCWRVRSAGRKVAMVRAAVALHEWEHTNAKVSMMEESKRAYLRKNFTQHGEWERRMNRCVSFPVHSRPLNQKVFETVPSALEVRPAWQDGWLLELSPSGLMIPTIGRIGTGPVAALPPELMHRLGPSPWFARLGSLQSSEVETFVFRTAAGASDL